MVAPKRSSLSSKICIQWASRRHKKSSTTASLSRSRWINERLIRRSGPRVAPTLYRRMQSFLERLGTHSAIRSQRSAVLLGNVLRACSRRRCSSAVHVLPASGPARRHGSLFCMSVRRLQGIASLASPIQKAIRPPLCFGRIRGMEDGDGQTLSLVSSESEWLSVFLPHVFCSFQPK